MAVLFAGLLILVAVMMISRWFVTASPATVLRTAKWTGGVLALGVFLLLCISGRLGWALAVLGALTPWLARIIYMRTLFRFFRSRFAGGAGVNAPSARQSQVNTAFLKVTLDHDSGMLTGEVMDGPLAGRQLSQLSFEAALELHRFCAADPQSSQLLEAWLDRTWPDWREAASLHGGGQGEP